MSDLDVLDAYKPVLHFDRLERCFPVVRARLVRDDGDMWAQYWMFYERDYSPLPWRRGHPSDVEMVQYVLSDSHAIGLAAYAQHQGGALHDFGQSHDPPPVYVALGKHACYFTPGYHVTGGFDFDRANGKGRRVDPDLIPSGERPPGHHPQWDHPTDWAWSLAGATGKP